jgi:Protein phosphatase 2C
MAYHMDSYFAIGKQHANEGKPCQDYAIACVEGDTAIAVVSDGCSTGGMTDVGARIVAHSVLKMVKDKPGFDFLCRKNHEFHWAIPSHRWIYDSAQGLSLKDEDLYATSLLIRACEESLKVHILGDGVVAHKFQDGSIWARRYEWDKGAPYYPIYSPQEFVDQVSDGDWDALSCSAEDYRYSPSKKEWILHEKQALTSREGIHGFSPWISKPKTSSFSQEFLAVFSDGVTQIKDVDWKDAVFQLLDFKNTTGQFVKRRMMKALKTMTPLDDISCAVLRISADADNDNDAIDA